MVKYNNDSLLQIYNLYAIILNINCLLVKVTDHLLFFIGELMHSVRFNTRQ